MGSQAGGNGAPQTARIRSLPSPPNWGELSVRCCGTTTQSHDTNYQICTPMSNRPSKTLIKGMLDYKKSQLDNRRIPHQSCSYTSMAMCAAYFGVTPWGDWDQLEDEMSEFAELKKGLTRGCPYAMDYLIDDHFGPHAAKTEHGIENVFHEYGSIDLIKDALLQGHPVIIQGDFTPSGHVIVVIGYDDSAYGGLGALIVLDPYGECDLKSQSYEGMPTSVGPYEYSYPGIERLCIYPDGTFWVHVIRPIVPPHVVDTPTPSAS